MWRAISCFSSDADAARAWRRTRLPANKVTRVSQVHLFLDKSGTLSKDILTIPNFRSWNFSTDAEGIPDGGHFRAILITLRITAPGEHFAKGKVADVTLTNHDKKVVKRARVADVYIGTEGAIFAPVFVEDAACGPFDLVVTGKGKRIAKRLEIHCGE